MQITLGTPKGGAGKTTALLSLANAAKLRHPECRVALIDTDEEVGSLRAFIARRGKEQDTDRSIRLWSVGARDGIDRLVDALARANDWADYIFVDVHGGISTFNAAIVEASAFTLFPTRIGLTDFEPAAKLFCAYEDRAERLGRTFGGSLLFTFAPNTRFLSTTEKKVLAGMRAIGIPFLNTIVQTRTVYKDAQDQGLFLREMPISAGLVAATDESIGMFDEIMAILGAPNPRAEAEGAAHR